MFPATGKPHSRKAYKVFERGGNNGNESDGNHEERNRENLFQGNQGKVPGLFRGRAVRSTGLLGNELPVVPLSVRQETGDGNQRVAEVLQRESATDGKGRVTPWNG